MYLFMNTIKHLCQPLANNNNKYGSSSASGTAEASMKCAICDRGFEYYSNLRRHIKTKHKIFGKQVKEYVVRHQTNSTHSSGITHGSTTNQPQSLKPSAAKEAPTNASSNSSDSNNSSQIQQSASAIMMMSPQSAASNQNTSSNYMDLGLNSKSTLSSSSSSSSNGKNSPLSSMSSSSMSSTKSLNKSANNSQR